LVLKIYRVGGYVRDKLLGKSSKDIDFVVTGMTPKKMLKLGFKVVGKSFPVFLHPITGEEFALARREKKVGKGYNGFRYEINGVSLEEDLKRRDLTINSIAEDENGKIIDPFGGRKDLENRVLRHTSEAFKEDPVRVLRVARFKASLGEDFQIAEETISLIGELKRSGELKHLTKERILLELEKVSQNGSPYIFFKTLQDLDLLNDIFPYVKNFQLLEKFERNLNFKELISLILIQSDRKDLKNELHFSNEVDKFSKMFSQFDSCSKKISGQSILELLKLFKSKEIYLEVIASFQKIFNSEICKEDPLLNLYDKYLKEGKNFNSFEGYSPKAKAKALRFKRLEIIENELIEKFHIERTV
jgi:tRNA nucleotidyltransferase (CCA-adding enzyme)